MTENNNLNKSIGESLGEIFNSHADHNVDSNTGDDSNDCNVKKYLCDECPEWFFKMKGTAHPLQTCL